MMDSCNMQKYRNTALVCAVCMVLVCILLIYISPTVGVLFSSLFICFYYVIYHLEAREARERLDQMLDFLHVPQRIRQRIVITALGPSRPLQVKNQPPHRPSASFGQNSATNIRRPTTEANRNFLGANLIASSPKGGNLLGDRTKLNAPHAYFCTSAQGKSPGSSTSSPRERSIGVKTSQAVAGPTLASTRFRQNLDYSVFAEVNSPGFSERIASYHQEANSEIPNSRYSTPGHFPSVKLMKDHVPRVTMKGRPKVPSPVTVRIAPPVKEYHDSSFTSRFGRTREQTRNEEPTQSVLDALKEISRKRIHRGEKEANKRHKNEEQDTLLTPNEDSHMSRKSVGDSNSKRNREKSPEEQRCLKRSPIAKRPCSNEIASSLSSIQRVLDKERQNGVASPELRSKKALELLAPNVTLVQQTSPHSTSTPTLSHLEGKSETPSKKEKKLKQHYPEPEEEIPIAESSEPLRPLFGKQVSPDLDSSTEEPRNPVFATMQTEETSKSPVARKARELREKKLQSLFQAIRGEDKMKKLSKSSPATSSVPLLDRPEVPAASLTSSTTLTPAITSPVVSTAQQGSSLANLVLASKEADTNTQLFNQDSVPSMSNATPVTFVIPPQHELPKDSLVNQITAPLPVASTSSKPQNITETNNISFQFASPQFSATFSSMPNIAAAGPPFTTQSNQTVFEAVDVSSTTTEQKTITAMPTLPAFSIGLNVTKTPSSQQPLPQHSFAMQQPTNNNNLGGAATTAFVSFPAPTKSPTTVTNLSVPMSVPSASFSFPSASPNFMQSVLPPTSTSNPSAFGQSMTQPAPFSFGQSPKPSSQPVTCFGDSMQSSLATSAAPNFMFGASAPSIATISSTTAASSQTTSMASSSSSMFGDSAPPLATSGGFGSSSTAVLSTPLNFSKPASGGGSVFGQATNTSPAGFGSDMFGFGGQKPVETSNAFASSGFGSSSTRTNQPGQFTGSTLPLTNNITSAGGFQFGNTSTNAASKPLFGEFAFGDSKTAAPDPAPPAYGSTTSKPIFANPFGAPPNQSPFQQQVQQAPTAPSASSNFVFGSNPTTSAPVVGGFAYPLSATTTSAASGNTSSSSASSSTFSFGSSKPVDTSGFTFNLPSNNPAPQPFGFSTPNSAQSTFSFGDFTAYQQQQQEQQQQQAQQATSFGFQFGGGGAASSTHPSQFKFSGGGSTAAAQPSMLPQGAGAAGMFSIGTGAAAVPRGRQSAMRRRKPN